MSDARNDMLECDGCRKWFHAHREKVSDAVVSTIETTGNNWLCNVTPHDLTSYISLIMHLSMSIPPAPSKGYIGVNRGYLTKYLGLRVGLLTHGFFTRVSKNVMLVSNPQVVGV